jgi:hypothetical protein
MRLQQVLFDRADRRIDQLERSSTVLTVIPGGSDLATSSRRSATAEATTRLLPIRKHQRGADNDFLAVFGSRAGAQFAADPDRGDVANRDTGHRHG